MSANLNAQQNEEVRRAVLGIVAARHPAALSTKQIHHRAAMQLDFAQAEPSVESACVFLKSAELLAHPDPDEEVKLGVTKYWIATHKGILQAESEA